MANFSSTAPLIAQAYGVNFVQCSHVRTTLAWIGYRKAKSLVDGEAGENCIYFAKISAIRVICTTFGMLFHEI